MLKVLKKETSNLETHQLHCLALVIILQAMNFQIKYDLFVSMWLSFTRSLENTKNWKSKNAWSYC